MRVTSVAHAVAQGAAFSDFRLERLHVTDSLLALQTVASQSFLETYRTQVPLELLDAHIAESFTLERLNQELHSPHIAFFAWQSGGANILAGYLKIIADAGLGGEPLSGSAYLERNYLLAAYHGLGWVRRCYKLESLGRANAA